MKISTTPTSSPMKKDHVTPNRFSPLVQPGMKPPRAMSRVAGTRELRVPARKARQARQRRDEIHDDGDAAPDGPEHRQVRGHPHHAGLGHEDVGRVDRAEDEGERADDVEGRREDPQVRRHGRPDGNPDLVDRVAGGRDRTVRVAQVTASDARTRMAADRWPTQRRSSRVTSPTANADASEAPTTSQTVASDAGVPSRAYFTEVSRLKRPASANETATKYPKRVRFSR